jgi:hypothetical protein
MTTFSWDRKCLLFTNHALVLGVIAADPAVRIRDIAERVEITERAVEILLGDLIQVGFLTRKRVGRRNVYEVHQHEKLRHPLIGERDVAGVVRAMLPAKKQPKSEVAFANPRISPAIPEQSFARAASIVHPMNMSTVTSTKKGVTMKQVLVYVVVAVLLLFASAALAATTRWHRAEHRPAPMHHTPGTQKQGRAQGAQGPPTSASSNPASTPLRPAGRVRHRYPANLHTGIHRATADAGGGQPAGGGTSDTSRSATVTVAGATVGVTTSGDGINVGIGDKRTGTQVHAGAGSSGITATADPSAPGHPPDAGNTRPVIGDLPAKLGL